MNMPEFNKSKDLLAKTWKVSITKTKVPGLCNFTLRPLSMELGTQNDIFYVEFGGFTILVNRIKQKSPETNASRLFYQNFLNTIYSVA